MAITAVRFLQPHLTLAAQISLHNQTIAVLKGWGIRRRLLKGKCLGKHMNFQIRPGRWPTLQIYLVRLAVKPNGNENL